MKKYRVKFHYYRQYKCMSIHWKGQCYKVDNINCTVSVETKWSKSQPNLILQGFATKVLIKPDINGQTAYII